MLTRRLASDLVTRLAHPLGPHELLRPLGFSADPLPLDDAAARALNLPPSTLQPLVVTGFGALRALACAVDDDAPLRITVAKIVKRVIARAPHQLWVFVVRRTSGTECALATWQPINDAGRICALVVHPTRPLDSDAETIVALAAAFDGAAASADILLHARWCEILGRDALSSRFYRALERNVVSLGDGAVGNAPPDARRSLALLAASRLLFLSFLQGKGWLNGDADFLAHHVDDALALGGNLQRRFFDPLFFGTLNTPVAKRAAAARNFGVVPFLNGGLFARTPLERRFRTLRFRDEGIATLFDEVLTRYRFTTREEQRDWSEAAIDPEMLGRAFESLMASRERRDSGAYYTPHTIVARVAECVLDEVAHSSGISLAGIAALRDGKPLASDDAALARLTIPKLRILDPACGTGAFLVHILERLAAQLRLAGDERTESTLRRTLLTHSIFGVDINPMAAWLCELRLWLSVVIDLPDGASTSVPPLPNLDRNIRVGDALAGGSFDDVPYHSAVRRPATRSRPPLIDALRARYARATGARKHTLARRLDSAERSEAVADADRRLNSLTHERRTLVSTARGRDLFGARRGPLGPERRRLIELRQTIRSLRGVRSSIARGGALPFRFASHFADAAKVGGFDVVVGNPPWVRLHRIPPEKRESMRRDFRVFREAAWKRGADDAAAGAGFAAQVDLSALFVERGISLLRPEGLLGYLLPMKLWRSLAGGGVRQLLGDDNELLSLEDWSESPTSFDAAVYPSIVLARRRRPKAQRPRRPGEHGEEIALVQASAHPSSDEYRQHAEVGAHASQLALGNQTRSQPTITHETRLGLHRRDLAITWRVAPSSIPLDQTPGAPWLLLPPDAREAFTRLANAGPPLASSGLGRPTLGVKSGCNAAFLVRESRQARGDVTGDDGRTGEVEPHLLRPVIRGESAMRWAPMPNEQRIIWTHDDVNRPIRSLPPLAARWLAKWRHDLARRADARAGTPWWSLFRLDGACFDRPRVVWADVSRTPRASILVAGAPWVPLNSCYVLPCRVNEDAAAFAAILNSPLAAAWLDAIAEPARGGFHRYLGWTVARLPIPSDWARARSILAPLAKRGVEGDRVSDAELLDAVISAYRIRRALVLPLVEWRWQ